MQSCLRLLKCPPSQSQSQQRNNGRGNDKVRTSMSSPDRPLPDRALYEGYMGTRSWVGGLELALERMMANDTRLQMCGRR